MNNLQSFDLFDPIQDSIAVLEDAYYDKELDVDWVLPFTGTKINRVLLQMAITIFENQPTDKKLHIVHTSTGIDFPSLMIQKSRTFRLLEQLSQKGVNLELHELKPSPNDSFWVRIIGRGLPAPARGFTWCSDEYKLSTIAKWLNRQENAHLFLDDTPHLSSTELLNHPYFNDHFSIMPFFAFEDADTEEYLTENDYCSWGESNKRISYLYETYKEDFSINPTDPRGVCSNTKYDLPFACWACPYKVDHKSLQTLVNTSDGEWFQPLLSFQAELTSISSDPSSRIDRAFHQRMDHKNWDDRKDYNSPFSEVLTLEARESLLNSLKETEDIMNKSHYLQASLISNEEIELIQEIWRLDRNRLNEIPITHTQTSMYDLK